MNRMKGLRRCRRRNPNVERRSSALLLRVLRVMLRVIENEIHPGRQTFASAQPESFIVGGSATPRRETGIASLAHLQMDVVDCLFAVRNAAITHWLLKTPLRRRISLRAPWDLHATTNELRVQDPRQSLVPKGRLNHHL